MKNQFTIEKNTSGYTVNVKYSRISFLKAFLSGNLTLEMDKETASSVSNALYTPKAKKPATSSNLASAIKSALASEEKPARKETEEKAEKTPKAATKPRRAPRKKPAASATADK